MKMKSSICSLLEHQTLEVFTTTKGKAYPPRPSIKDQLHQGRVSQRIHERRAHRPCKAFHVPYNSDEKELLVYATDSERAGIAQTMWLFGFYQELFNDFLVSGVVAFALDRLRKCICLLPVSFVFYRISPAVCHRSTCPAVLFAGFVQFFKHILDACSITTVFFLNLLVLD